jgi:hypothetical protein
MKFTAGYILGATTAVGLGVAFVGGFISYGALKAAVEERKNETIDKIKDVDIVDAAASSLFKSFRGQ